jgi:hypothetical protein
MIKSFMHLQFCLVLFGLPAPRTHYYVARRQRFPIRLPLFSMSETSFPAFPKSYYEAPGLALVSTADGGYRLVSLDHNAE